MTNLTLYFNQFLIWPILNVLVLFYKTLTAFHIPGAFGFAIIGLTMLIRLILMPLTSSQLKSAKKMVELKPRLDELTKRHGKDKQRLQQEQLRLYKEAGVNPAAGCLPLILQMPVFIALYQVFWQVLGTGNLTKVIEEINKIVYLPLLKIETLNLSFFGLNLGAKPTAWKTEGWWLLLIPVVTALLQWYQTKLMTPSLQPATSNLPVGKAGKQQTTSKDDTSQVFQQQMAMMMPLMIGFFAFSFPVGLSLYWNTFSVFGIIQQIKINSPRSFFSSKIKINKNNGKKD